MTTDLELLKTDALTLFDKIGASRLKLARELNDALAKMQEVQGMALSANVQKMTLTQVSQFDQVNAGIESQSEEMKSHVAEYRQIMDGYGEAQKAIWEVRKIADTGDLVSARQMLEEVAEDVAKLDEAAGT